MEEDQDSTTAGLKADSIMTFVNELFIKTVWRLHDMATELEKIKMYGISRSELLCFKEVLGWARIYLPLLGGQYGSLSIITWACMLTKIIKYY